MTAKTGSANRLTAFRRREDGAITVEAVLWLPFYLMFFSLIADVSMMFHGQAKAQRIAQDVNRLAVLTWTENWPDPNQSDVQNMKDWAEALVHPFAPNATVTAYFKSDRVQTFITLPANDLQPVGLFGAFINFDIQVSAAHLREL